MANYGLTHRAAFLFPYTPPPQDGVYLAIGSSKRYILDVLREKIQGRLHGVTETRRFFAQLLEASESFDVARVGAPGEGGR